MDSDLTDALKALKAVFERRLIPANFRPAGPEVAAALKRKLSLSDRYAAFLEAADPLDVETATPSERVRFIPAADLEQEQAEYGGNGWRDGYVVIAHSALLGDPYFLDTSNHDAEGDCPVLTAMSGTDHLSPVLCASSFASFVQILATAMDLAEDFADTGDPDDEHIFREALGHKIKSIDHAAARERHWNN